MNYPAWEPSLLGDVIIGFIAILHVFVSHFAVGGGLFLPLTERKAYRDNNPALLEYVRSHSKFFVLVVRKENAFTVAPPFRAAHAGLKPGATTI